jgi:hypothetical protein
MSGSLRGTGDNVKHTYHPPGNETDGTDELERIYDIPDTRPEDEASDIRSDS